ncbi:hypothetical protein [Labilibacter marinus]|uniref:hypothetical protein n=1 Tax=Labilibacter marinus TaxID=1477105 RepID=UPI00094FA3A6|nr:hypothetical protein [Labilibacter marinus]
MLRILLVIIILTLVTLSIKAQGCSDAGVCSIDSYKNTNNQLAWSVSQSAELGENFILYLHTTIGMRLPLGEKAQVSMSLPYRNSIYKGELYTGFSDATVASSFNITSEYNIIAGLKIPLSESNNSKDGVPLPMALQQGLGTFDAIISIDRRWKQNKLSMGYQYVFGTNNNAFMGNDNFGASANLERGDDFMLRYDRYWGKEHRNWKASLVSVYRIGGDKINDGEFVEKSKGLSINVAMVRSIQLKNNELELMMAVPVVARKARVDGLTRNFILSAKLNGIF